MEKHPLTRYLSLFVFGIFLCLTAPVQAANTLIYKTISSKTNIQRGAMQEDLFRFSLTLATNSDSAFTLSQMVFSILENNSNAGQAVFRKGHLFSVENGNLTEIASAPPIGSFLYIILNSSLSFDKGQTREFVLKGDFLLNPSSDTSHWTNTRILFYNNDQCFIGTPTGSLTLSNADTTGSTVLNTIYVYDNLLAISNSYPTIGQHAVFEWGNEYTMMGFTLSNVNYHETGGTFTVNNLEFTVLPDIAYISSLKIFLDGGDTSPGGDDTLIYSYQPMQSVSGTSLPITLNQPLLMDDSSKIIWVNVTISPNNGSSLYYMGLDLSDPASFATLNKISLMPPYQIYYSCTNNLTDATPPGSVTGVTAVNGNDNLLLSWINPGDQDLNSIRIAYNTTGWPVVYNEATYIDISATPGASVKTVLSNLGSGPVYYAIYSADSFSPQNTNLSYSNTYTMNTAYDTQPVTPTGVLITPHRDKIEIKWDHDTDPGHYAYSIRFYEIYNGTQVYPSPEQYFFTNHIFIDKTELGISNFSSSLEMYVSVVNINLNGKRSANDFDNTTEATSKGIRVVYQPQTSSTTDQNSTVYNNFFHPDTGGYARILVNMPQENNLLVKVYSISGELMRTLVNSRVSSGEHEYRWYGKDKGGIVNPGVYIVHVRFGDHNRTHKVVVRR